MTARLSFVFAGLLCVAAHAAGETASPDPGQQLVENFVTEVTTFSGRFEQSLIDASGDIIETTSGTLEIRRPGQFRWSYVEPYEQVLVADGLNIWSYDVDLAQVTVKPQAEALSNTPALLLGGSADAMQQFVHEGSYDKEQTTWVRMSPTNTESGFLRVEMGFMNGELSRMVFFDNLDQTTVVALHNVRVNEPIDATRFEFEIPADADVVGTPAVAELSVP